MASFLILITGCDTTQPDSSAPSELRIQMLAGDASGDPVTSGRALQEVPNIQQIRMFVDEMELEGERIKLEMRYFIIDLPPDGSPFVLLEQMVPHGTYDEFELEIEKPDDDSGLKDRDFRDETGSYSIVVRGLYNGEEFKFRSREDFEIEIEFHPPLVISESENVTLTIGVDINRWFTDRNGNPIDPKDPANTEQINKNIERSFKIFEKHFD